MFGALNVRRFAATASAAPPAPRALRDDDQIRPCATDPDPPADPTPSAPPTLRVPAALAVVTGEPVRSRPFPACQCRATQWRDQIGLPNPARIRRRTLHKHRDQLTSTTGPNCPRHRDCHPPAICDG